MAQTGGAALTGAATVEHLLALKVMRLTRPTLATPLVLPTEAQKEHAIPPNIVKDVLQRDLLTDSNSLSGLEDLSIGTTLVLPQSFGNIYLGETFTSYVSLHNDSTETCDKVSLRCDLQTATQRIPLFPTENAHPLDAFEPGSALDHVLHHEVKELGTHILVCEVAYTPKSQTATGTSIATASGPANLTLAHQPQRLSFRKFFKFQVMKPLDVKTKFYNAESDEIFLEAQVQNVTSGPLCLEKVALDPSQLFTVKALNTTNGENEDGFSVFGKINCIQPQDSRQYLFCLMPKPEIKGNHKLMKGVTNIGKLDIVWRTNMGDRGRLQTSQLQRVAPNHGDVRLIIEHVPSMVQVGEAFTVGAKVINNCDRTVELDLNLVGSCAPNVTWSGVTTQSLGLLEPAGSIDLEVHAVAHHVGLQVISGLRLTDSLLKRTYDFDDVCQIYIAERRELIHSVGL